MNYNETLNPQIVKYIDYASEEYIKSVITAYKADRQLQSLNPFIGVVRYPSSQFLTSSLTYGKTVQAKGTAYIGHMEMLLPDAVTAVDHGLAYTLLSFELDGVVRRFLQVSGGQTVGQNGTFNDLVYGLYPDANQLIPFNRHALHIINDIEISGASYTFDAGAGVFTPQTSGQGAFTPSIEFEFSISGYRCLII